MQVSVAWIEVACLLDSSRMLQPKNHGSGKARDRSEKNRDRPPIGSASLWMEKEVEPQKTRSRCDSLPVREARDWRVSDTHSFVHFC